jgi:beta-lactamase regulating signal transducer with metallopeptidase domain
MTALLIQCAVKGTMVLLLAFAAATLMRRASASHRHLLWLLAMLAILLLPVLSSGLPAWNVMTIHDQAPVMIPQTPLTAQFSQVVTSGSDMQSSVAAPVRWNLPEILISAWAFGAVLTLSPLLIGRLSLWRLARAAQSCDDELCRRLRQQLGIRRPMRVLRSDRRAMPMTWGILHPHLLLPADEIDWPMAKRRVVLAHELAHVQRWDCLTQLIARLACAMHWFNPLVWIAAAKMAAAREAACDDVVLNLGAAGPDYAEQLLKIACAAPMRPILGAAAIGMARSSRLERRVRSILDAGRSRVGVSKSRTCVGAILAILLAMPIAMLRADAPATQPGSAIADAPRTRHFVELVVGPDRMTFQGQLVTWDQLSDVFQKVPDRASTVFCVGYSSDQVTLAQFNEARFAELAQKFGFESLSNVGQQPLGTMGRSDETMKSVAEVVRHAVETISTCSEGDPKVADALQSLQGLPDADAVAQLTGYLNSDVPEMRRAAIYVLWRGPFHNIDAAVDPLVQFGHHNEDFTRGMSALALGARRVRSAEDIIVNMATTDSSSYARRCAAYALGLMGDPAMIDTLQKVAQDPDPQVAANAKTAIRMLQGQ